MFLSIITRKQLKCVTKLLQRQLLQQTIALPARIITTGKHNQHINDFTIGKHIKFKQIRYYHITNQNNRTQIDDEINTINEHINEIVDTDDTANSLKTLLYSEGIDCKLMKDINNVANFNELLQVMNEKQALFDKKHYVQCVLIINSLLNLDTNESTKAQLIEKCLEGLHPHISKLDFNELGCCYYYLRILNVPNTNVTLRDILSQASYMIDLTTPECPPSLTSLSRLLLAMNRSRSFYIPTVCAHFLPHVLQHIKSCTTAKDAYLLAICFINLKVLIDKDTLLEYKSKINDFINADIINKTTTREIIKILQMLNLPHWSNDNTQLIRKLSVIISPAVEQLNTRELRQLTRICQYHLEPATLYRPLRKAIKKLLENEITPASLAYFLPFAKTEEREKLTQIYSDLITNSKNWEQINAIQHFFIILRSLKISDAKLCDLYWSELQHELDNAPSDQQASTLLRLCHNYMNFNNNLGGTYRNKAFEQKLTHEALLSIENKLDGRIPHRFVKLAAFAMAYGHTPFNHKKFPNMILTKIINMSEQFNIIDCYVLGRGVQTALELRYRHDIPSTIQLQLQTIDSILIRCAERHLNSHEELNLNELNFILKTLSSRKSLRNTMIYQEALNKYQELDYSHLNSRIIRDMLFNFTTSNFLIPKAIDSIFDYIAKHHEHILGDTVEKALSCSFQLGYTPNSEEGLEYAASILMRDFHYMSGLSLVQSCLALCYFKVIPAELIDEVFCVKFIQRLEDEIQTCYSKITYPERVLNMVMQLNRTICLDYPEANVPWFQQNFIESQLSKKPALQNRFNGDVKKMLEALFDNDSYFRCNHITPYGYQIDFVIHFDRDKKPIASPVETTMLDRITKVAILLLKLDSFCENDLSALRGPILLKMKHLEMMGYKVLHINEHDWNSKYMNVPGAKKNYLKCLLQISS